MYRSVGWIARKDRVESCVDAVVHRPDGTELRVRLTNFSDEGCRVEGGRSLPIGERVEIAIPDMGRVRAQVRWSLNGKTGIRFDDDND